MGRKWCFPPEIVRRFWFFERFHVEHRAVWLVSRIVANVGWHLSRSALMWKELRKNSPSFTDTSALKDIVKDTLWIKDIFAGCNRP